MPRNIMKIKFGSSGDTIVEVLVAMAVVSLVLGAAFVVSSQSTHNIRQSQEHASVLKTLESQIEQLKSAAKNPNSPIFSQTGAFCLNGGVVYDDSQPQCIQGTVPDGAKMSIIPQGSLFSATATWQGPRGTQERVNIVYKLYKDRIVNIIPTPPPPAPPPPPVVPPDPCDPVGLGLFRGCYFNDPDGDPSIPPNPAIHFLPANRTAYTSDTPRLNNDWGTGSPGSGVDADYFSVRWKGNFNFSQAGDYTFTVRADDGFRVYFDGSPAPYFSAFVLQSPTVYTFTKNMTAGDHSIVVEYYEHSGGAVAQFDWTKTDVIEAETFTGGGGCNIPFPDGALSGGAGFQYCTNGTYGLSKTTSSFNRMSVRANGSYYNGDPNMIVWVDGQQRFNGPVASTGYNNYIVPLPFTYGTGNHQFQVSFSNDGCACPSGPDRNLFVDRIDVWQSPSFAMVMPQQIYAVIPFNRRFI